MRSANEISGLVLKAARGAGMPLGCAEELARAAPHLAHSGDLPLVAELLNTPCTPPELIGDVLSGGHAVLRAASLLDLEAAGRKAQAEPALPAALDSAMRAVRQGKAVAGPFAVGAELLARLEPLAAKTFVPETEASRLAGAGAGLTDND